MALFLIIKDFRSPGDLPILKSAKGATPHPAPSWHPSTRHARHFGINKGPWQGEGKALAGFHTRARPSRLERAECARAALDQTRVGQIRAGLPFIRG